MNFCEVCFIAFSKQLEFQSHVNSNAHYKAIRFQERLKENNLASKFYCEICSVCATSEKSLLIHQTSMQHSQKEMTKRNFHEMNQNVAAKLPIRSSTMSDINRELKDYLLNDSDDKSVQNLSVNSEESYEDTNDKWCHVCICKYTSELQKNAHLNGKDHKKKVELMKKIRNSDIELEYVCAYCCVHTSQNDFLIHMRSSPHLVQIKRYDEYYEDNKHSGNLTIITENKYKFQSAIGIRKSKTEFSLGFLKSDESNENISNQNQKLVKKSYDLDEILNLFSKNKTEKTSNLDDEMNVLEKVLKPEENVGKIKEESPKTQEIKTESPNSKEIKVETKSVKIIENENNSNESNAFESRSEKFLLSKPEIFKVNSGLTKELESFNVKSFNYVPEYSRKSMKNILLSQNFNLLEYRSEFMNLIEACKLNIDEVFTIRDSIE